MAYFRRIGGTFASPVGTPIVDYDTVIGGDSRVVQWWDFNAARVTQSGGLVSAVAPRKSGGASLVQATGSKQPNYVATTAEVNDRPTLYFDQLASVDVLVASPNTIYPVSTDSTLVALVNFSTVASTTFPAGGGSAATGLHLMTSGVSSSVQQVGQRVGTSGTQATVSTPMTKGDWHLVALPYEKTAGQASVSVDGLPFVLGTANPSAVISDTTFAIGAPASGSPTSASHWAMAMILNVSLRTGNDDLLAHIKQYVRDAFSLTVQ